MEIQEKNIVIIGGGAAGLLAAMRAAELGGSVAILEKMDKPARKLAITGKGRGNLTTGHDIDAAIQAFGPNGRFLRGAFSRFYSADLIALLTELGIETKMERGKRVFPLSHRASEVVDILLKRLGELGVEILPGRKVSRIIEQNGCATAVETSGESIPARSIILATGGVSYPGTGSTGDGYRMASALGHSIIEPSPALVPIELHGGIHRELNALSLKNVKVSMFHGDTFIAEEFGDMMFTPFGATGPAVLPLGKHVARHSEKDSLTLCINFKPALSPEQLDARLQRDFAAAGKKSINEILAGLLPRRAVPVFMRLGGLEPILKCNQVSRQQRATLAALLHRLDFHIKGTRPIAEAIVTSGGVALNEVNPKTMESKIVAGLYICGELLDVDAGTGGFNLQAAFSTGYIAGENACYNSQNE